MNKDESTQQERLRKALKAMTEEETIKLLDSIKKFRLENKHADEHEIR